MKEFNRRNFLKYSGLAGGAFLLGTEEGPAMAKNGSLVALAKADVFLASTDRVAIDATGVALLKLLGSNQNIMSKKIFDQEQIARAAELGLGVSSPFEIALIPADGKSQDCRDRVWEILKRG